MFRVLLNFYPHLVNVQVVNEKNIFVNKYEDNFADLEEAFDYLSLLVYGELKGAIKSISSREVSR